MNIEKPWVLQSFIVPICRISKSNRNVDFLYGTAFFTNVLGVFITAKHVIQDMLTAQQQEQDPTKLYGLNVKGSDGGNLFVMIDVYEFHPNHDIAIGRVNFDVKSPIKLMQGKRSILQDVWTVGYPANALDIDMITKTHWIGLRGHKGYISRYESFGIKNSLYNPSCSELSFRIDLGMSGSPLFINNNYTVGGICIGTRTSDEHIYSVNKNEKVPQLFEYGIAVMTCELKSWVPDFLENSDELFQKE
ncbi:MAG: serine protease [Candidatus Babeliales bacterium]|nr:serine protease [Candidatus Babeliales bacterium]